MVYARRFCRLLSSFTGTKFKIFLTNGNSLCSPRVPPHRNSSSYRDTKGHDLEFGLNNAYGNEVSSAADSLINTPNQSNTPQWTIGAHSVLVLQPKVAWGSKKPSDTSAELMLEESCALVRTLPDWRVAASKLVSVKYEIDHSKVFGSGNLQRISCRVASDASITAIFVNIDVLSPVQQTELSAAFRKPVYDRARLRELTIGAIPDTLNALDFLGGHGYKILEERANMFKKRESYLKKALEQVRKTREQTHEQIRKNYPLIGVIGYTNSGKTSLVNCLTKSLREKEQENLQPKDRLFATLDCSMFMGQLPVSRVKAYFADTVGFVADIPASLIACFEATLDCIRHASLLIHVMDISHPDAKLQQITVHSTLKKMNLPSELLKNMIEVHNKVDKAGRIEVQSLSNTIFDISCVTGEGIPSLQREIEKIIKIVDKFITVRLKVPNGGEQLRYLQDNTSISNFETLDDGNFLIVTTSMHDFKLKAIFKQFGNLLYR